MIQASTVKISTMADVAGVKTASISVETVKAPEYMRRFFEKVAENSATGCHEWTAYTRENGYGVIQTDGLPRSAHRIAWTIANGPIPDGLFVLHKCDNRKCVNPEHLFLGTARENVLDMRAKGRGADVRGENNPASKLSVSQRADVARMYANSEISISEIAEMFGICAQSVLNCASGLRRGRAGQRNGRAKLTTESAGLIREMYARGESASAAARAAGVTFPTAKRVIRGESFV